MLITILSMAPLAASAVLLASALAILVAGRHYRATRETLGRSQRSADEYDRARRDYEQLMRHRIANPLTVISGGISTLLHCEETLDPDTRRELLRSIAASAEQLSSVALTPAQVSAEEHELHAVPRHAHPSRTAAVTVTA